MTETHGYSRSRGKFSFGSGLSTRRVSRAWRKCTYVPLVEKFGSETGAGVNCHRLEVRTRSRLDRRLDRRPSLSPFDRIRKPPAASRIKLVPEELHDVRGRCIAE